MRGLVLIFILLSAGWLASACQPAQATRIAKNPALNSSADGASGKTDALSQGEEAVVPLTACAAGNPDCAQEFHFLAGAFVSTEAQNPNVLKFDTLTAYAIELSDLAERDRIYVSADIALTTESAVVTEARGYVRVKGEDNLVETSESISSATGNLALGGAALHDIKTAGNKSFSYQVEAGKEDIVLDQDRGGLVAMIWRKMSLAQALRQTDGYFFLGFHKPQISAEQIASSPDLKTIGSKTIGVEAGDLLVVQVSFAWQGSCASSQVEVGVRADADFVMPATTHQIGGQDRTVRFTRVIAAKESGEQEIELAARTLGRECNLKTLGQVGFVVQHFRPLSHLAKNMGKAYGLVNSGMVVLAKQDFGSAGSVQDVKPLLKKSFSLGARDVLVMESLTTIRAMEASKVSFLTQFKREPAGKLSAIGRTTVDNEHKVASTMIVDAHYAEKKESFTLVQQAAAVSQDRAPIKIETSRVIYHHFAPLPQLQ